MTTPTDTAKLADDIEALGKLANRLGLETDPSQYVKDSNIRDLICGGVTIAEFVHKDTAALIVALVNNHATIIAALRELDAVKAREAKLREAMKSALKRLEKGAPGWGVAKDELRAALGRAG